MEKIVEVKNLCKYFGKERILNDVSFDVYEDEIVGFIGPNGAGKSTTMKCICNLIFPTSGTISVCGFDVVKEREKALACQAALIENPGLYPDLNGLEHLKLFATIQKISKERMDEIIDFIKIDPSQLKKKTSRYSLGMKQRLALGLVLLGKPKFIILDEPTNGLDPRAIMELRETLRDLVEKEHISILFSSHALGEIEKIADRIICINHGKIIPTPETILDDYVYEVTTIPSITLKHLQSLSYVLHAKENNNTLQISFDNNTSLQMFISYCNEVLHVKISDITKIHQNIEVLYQEIYGDTI